MRMRIVAMTFGFGIAACGAPENRPVQDPSTTTVTTTSGASGSRTSTGAAAPSAASYDTTLPATPHKSAGVETLPATGAAATTTPAAPSGTSPTLAPASGAQVTSDPDDTGVNDRDRHGALTPMDQGNSKSEVAITAAIRKSVLSDKSLSFTAKNVKIITVGSKVTLRGPVGSDAERSAIEARARQTPGVTEVDDQIEVKK